jgi:hypothetical protein
VALSNYLFFCDLEFKDVQLTPYLKKSPCQKGRHLSTGDRILRTVLWRILGTAGGISGIKDRIDIIFCPVARGCIDKNPILHNTVISDKAKTLIGHITAVGYAVTGNG